MKKIYTLLAAMLLTVTTAFAQTLGVTVNGASVSNGTDYTLNLTLDEFRKVISGDFDSHIYAMEPEILVSSSIAQTVSVTAEDLDKIDGKTVEGNAQICFGGSCEPLEVRNEYKVTKTKDMAAGSSLDTETHINFGSVLFFDGEVLDGQVPTFPVIRRIRLTVEAGSEKLSFVLYLICDPDNKLASVNGVSADNAVSATAEGISYNLKESGILNVYSANGAAVMHENVEGNGTVSLSNLSAGVYVYSLKADGKHYTGKVAVK